MDDNEDLHKIVQLSLRDSYETLSAKNGEEAVGLAVMEVPDLILMDLMMYEIPGSVVTISFLNHSQHSN